MNDLQRLAALARRFVRRVQARRVPTTMATAISTGTFESARFALLHSCHNDSPNTNSITTNVGERAMAVQLVHEYLRHM